MVSLTDGCAVARYDGYMDEPAMTIRLPRDLYEKLRLEAFQRRIPMAQVIRDALAAHFEKEAAR